MTIETKLARIANPPRIYSRDEHTISRKKISSNALKVLRRLNNAGYRACLVGGGVRDLLLGLEPKDFDVATDARPEQVRDLFRNSRLIGRRFRLAHVRFGREVLEVATFRTGYDGNVDASKVSREGRILRDNVYGDIDQDVWRRDFTVNALYYDLHDLTVLDYVDGMKDLKRGVIKLIGEPSQRYREDPVRMLRAVRFAVKLGFRIDKGTAEPLSELSNLLSTISSARLYEEVLKMSLGGSALLTFEALRQHKLFPILFPVTNLEFDQAKYEFRETFVGQALANTDRRVAESKPVTPAFIVAALLWNAVDREHERLTKTGMTPTDAMSIAADRFLAQQINRLAVPRRITQVTREIWAMQIGLSKRSRRRVRRVVEHPRFRAAYDFLELRAQSGEPVEQLSDWWGRYQVASQPTRSSMLDELKGRSNPKGRRHHRG